MIFLFNNQHKKCKKVIMIMRISFFFIFCGILTVAAESYAQNTKLTLDMHNVSLYEVVTEIEKQSEFMFFYKSGDINNDLKVSIQVKDKTIPEILNEVMKNADLTYKVDNRHVLIAKKNSQAFQQITITGTVADATGDPLPGASVVLKGTTQGTVTDASGAYSITVSGTDASLVFSFVGFLSREITVGNQRILNVTLNEETREIQEVVVTALGIRREQKAVGYAVQNLKGDNLQTVKGVDLGTSLSGKISGVNVQNSTEFGQGPTVLVRGEEPLLVIDGVPYAYMTLRDITPDDIETLSVLKGATASALYGSRGQNGAIMVTTKKGAEKSGFSVSVNSGTMFTAGYLAIPKSEMIY